MGALPPRQPRRYTYRRGPLAAPALCPPVSVSRTCRLFSPASLRGQLVMVVLSTIAAAPTALCASTGSSTVFSPSSPRGSLMT
eukprot:scaffold10559_cov78-Isochrysis_galbana.AAC.1